MAMTQPSKFNEGDEVTVDKGQDSEVHGIVDGFYKDIVVVKLVNGYWVHNKKTYISMILVHPSNLTPMC